jgi:hypothetical protein
MLERFTQYFPAFFTPSPKQKDTAVKNNAHPDDPRVAVVDCERDFTRAADCENFQAVIYKNNLPADEIKNLAQFLSRGFNGENMPPRKIRKGNKIHMTDIVSVLGAAVFNKGIFSSADTDKNMALLETFTAKARIEELLDQMRKLYLSAGYSPLFNIVTGMNLQLASHPHDVPHIALTLGDTDVPGNTGTAWKNEKNGKLCAVALGDIILLKPGFEHESPPLRMNNFSPAVPSVTLTGGYIPITV